LKIEHPDPILNEGRYVGDEPARAIRKSRFGSQSEVRATAARIALGAKEYLGTQEPDTGECIP
jgi:hypothetical protein